MMSLKRGRAARRRASKLTALALCPLISFFASRICRASCAAKSWIMSKRASSSGSSSSKRSRSSGRHKEGWDPSFSVSYPWALPVEDRDEPGKIIGVLCKLCRKHGKHQHNHAGTWTDKPLSCIRKDILKRHGESVMHRDAQDRELALVQSQRDGGVRMAFEKGIAAQRVAVQGALKVVYWLCKEEVAHTTKYESLIDLAINLGCTYLEELNISTRANYRSRRIVGEFIELLSSITERDIIVKVKASPYFSLMTDESTDVAILKQLVLVARYILPTGDVETNYIRICDIPNGTATTIEDAILSYLDNKELDPRYLRGFGSDGANVMVGSINGVATSLKRKFPKLISIHCANYRLALAAAHAADNIPYFKKFKVALRSLFQFYQNSAVQMAGLHAIQEILNDPVIKLKEAKDVRWLSNEHAIKALIRILPSLITSLEREATERGEPTAVGLVRVVKTYYFISSCYLLSSVLPHINRLSLLFQAKCVDLTLLRPTLSATVEAIKGYRSADLKDADTRINGDLSEFNINVSPTQKDQFRRNIQEKYIDALVAQLENRFPDAVEVEAFSIFDPSKLPASSTDLSSYGNDKLALLGEKYAVGDSADFQVEDLTSEWESFKHLFSDNYRQESMQGMLKALATSESTVAAMYPCLSKLACIALVLPISTV